jgi:hypothetical protein
MWKRTGTSVLFGKVDKERDFSVPGHFAERHFAERHFAERHFAERQFAERTFCRRTVCRKDNLPKIEMLFRQNVWDCASFLKFVILNHCVK